VRAGETTNAGEIAHEIDDEACELLSGRQIQSDSAVIPVFRSCLGISGMKGNEGHWGGGISIISQNFLKSPSILFHPLESSISQTSPKYDNRSTMRQ
jgi:hypothetical protein